MTTIDPKAHDEAEAQLYGDLATAQATLTANWERVHRAARDKREWLGRRPRWSMTNGQALARLRIAGTERELVKAIETGARLIETIQASIAEAEAIYRQHGWVRFFLCTNRDGHIHATLHCSSLDRGQYATGMRWLPELSGTSVEQAVTTYREGLCTKCFPGAPVAWYERRDGAEQAAKAAEKAARDEAKFDKKLRETEQFRDGAVSGRTNLGDWVTTVAGAKQVLRDEVEFRDYYGRGPHPYHPHYLVAVEKAKAVLLAREAAKPGTGATQAEIDRIIAGAVKRNIKYGARLNADGTVKA